MSISTLYRVLVRETLVPLLLMLITPNMAVVLPYIMIHRNGDLSVFNTDGIITICTKAWSTVQWNAYQFPLIIAGLIIYGSLSILLLGGESYYGPLTETGFQPMYRRSGFRFYALSMIIFVPLIGYFSMLDLYYHFVTFAGYLVAFGFLFSIFLYIKGCISPSPGVFSRSSNVLFDFYWGIELYPRIGENLDLKTLINSRFGLFLWQLVCLACLKANYELYQIQWQSGSYQWPILVNVLLQTIYLMKFYAWEDGYMQTIDIALDRFGYYINWGCIAWVPTFYTLSSLYLVRNSPAEFDGTRAIVTFLCGLAMILLNYLSDYQRQKCRQTGGKFEIFGRQAKVLHAFYKDDEGRLVASVLLVDGFWGMARHLNYSFELAAALCWSVCGMNTTITTYLYFLYLVALLVHRSVRDDVKCRQKYGKYWEKYCEMVPYRFIPGII